MLLYVDEKRPITAKTHNDSSWNSSFKDEQEIGQAVRNRRIFIIKVMAKQSQIFYKRIYHCVYIILKLTGLRKEVSCKNYFLLFEENA